MKNKIVALLLSIFLGGWGIDRFYLGYIGMGILKLLTGGVFGILWIIDIVRIATGSLRPANGTPYEDEAQQSAAIGNPSSAAEDMTKLAALHEQGVLSDEEYTQMKSEIMGRL